jgi:hypothetical protein
MEGRSDEGDYGGMEGRREREVKTFEDVVGQIQPGCRTSGAPHPIYCKTTSHHANKCEQQTHGTLNPQHAFTKKCNKNSVVYRFLRVERLEVSREVRDA